MANPSTSTNGGQNLATINTPHAGMTVGPTDVCKVPSNAIPKPFPNTAPVERNPQGMTSKRTVVATNQIITVATTFGAPSDAAHEGKLGGILSGSYQGVAQVKVGSQDLRTEGKPPGRHLDETWQNKRNTDGILRDLKQALDAANKNAALLKRCTITAMVIKQDKKPRESVGGFLEIVEGSTCKVIATRKNMAAVTDPAKAPVADCKPPPEGWKDTKFRVVRTGGFVRQFNSTLGGAKALATGHPPTDETQAGKGDEFLLTTKWVGDPPASASSQAAAQGTKGPSEALTRGAAAAQRTGLQMGQGPGADATIGQLLANEGQLLKDKAAFDAAKKKAQYDAYKKTKDRIQANEEKYKAQAATAAKVIKSLQAFRDVWSSLSPPEISVTASACTGAYAGLVKVYPAGGFEFDVVEVAKTFFEPVSKALDGAQGLFRTILPKPGADWDVGFLNQSLVGGNAGKADPPVFKFGWEFKELERDAEDNGPKKHCVGVDFSLVIGIQKFLFARADFSVSLFKVFGGAFGAVAAKILEWCNITFTLGIALEINVGVTALFGRDEYHVKKWGDVDTSLLAMACIYIMARAGDRASAKCAVTFAFSFKWKDIRCGAAGRPPIDVFWADRKFSISFQCTLTAPVRGYVEGKTIPDEPIDLITPVTTPDGWGSVLPT